MAKQFSYYLLFGVLIGAVFGFGIGMTNGNTLLGLEIGAFFDVFIGWFAAAATL